MTLYGIQKLTLLDFPGRVACTLFTGGCNFRCPFCHNASLVLRPGECDPIGEEELFAFLERRRGVLDGVCLTGGEPLLQPDIGELISRIHALGFAVKLDTNGSFPDRLAALLQTGNVDYIAMDIKNSPAKYPLTVGVADYDVTPVRESARLLMEGSIPYEFRTTVVRELHTDEDFLSIGEWISGARAYYLQSFSDSGDLIGEGLHPYAKEDLERFRGLLLPRIPDTFLREI